MGDMEEDDEELDDYPDAIFNGSDCNCDHESNEHGWDGCLVEGCNCEASWEE